MEIAKLFLGHLAGLVPVVATAAALIAFIVDTAKRFGLPDGWAPLASGALNFVVYAIYFFAGDARLGDVDNVIAGLTLIAPVVVSLFLGLLGTKLAHDVLAWIGIGYKHPGAVG